MKKLGTLSLLVLLMVTLTGCTPKKDNIQNNKETNKESKETNSANEETFSGTMEELLKLGKNYKCTFFFFF